MMRYFWKWDSLKVLHRKCLFFWLHFYRFVNERCRCSTTSAFYGQESLFFFHKNYTIIIITSYHEKFVHGWKNVEQIIQDIKLSISFVLKCEHTEDYFRICIFCKLSLCLVLFGFNTSLCRSNREKLLKAFFRVDYQLQVKCNREDYMKLSQLSSIFFSLLSFMATALTHFCILFVGRGKPESFLMLYSFWLIFFFAKNDGIS